MEDYNNGQTGIITGLDNETVNALRQVQKNFNDDYMNGSSTSGFKERSVGENTATIINNNLIATVITPKLLAYATSYITNTVSSYLASSAAEMLAFNAGEIGTKAAQIVKDYIISPTEILSELMKTREQMNDEQIKESRNKTIEQINEKIGETVGNITKEINEKLDSINPTIANIAKYSQMGPAWVCAKTDLAIQKVVDNCVSKITKKKEEINKQKQDTINSLADGIAKQMAQKTNDETKQNLKNQNDEIAKKKQDAMNKVKTQIINAKLKIFALVGV